MGDFDWSIILLAIVPVLFALTVQAVAQVLAARHYGDTTAVQMGRLTLNPMPHIDFIGTIVLPLFSVWMFVNANLPLIIGWVKPVPINYGNMRNIRMGMRMVAASGWIANFLMLILWAVIRGITLHFGPAAAPVAQMAEIGIIVNIVLLAFGFIPLLPYAGGRFIDSFLPAKYSIPFQKTAMWSSWLILGLIVIAPKVLWLYIAPIYAFFGAIAQMITNLFL
ncbi:site-2 protease family protein [Vitreoscilla massiliensis]|uniref:Site-2 protease family protein n=1 Tax=Vitreoscilla massiliensis TaxID=1689272 RepID=A0ABY4E6M3_9NEIS|nr:site-2 protease family protein [Vitreoscilla massiliensis]UOO90996.1 site-2 protease family protein [Vitreoscilla massiliensis]